MKAPATCISKSMKEKSSTSTARVLKVRVNDWLGSPLCWSVSSIA